jgi:hypothetical protein
MLRFGYALFLLENAKTNDGLLLGGVTLKGTSRAILFEDLYPISSAAWDNRKYGHDLIIDQSSIRTTAWRRTGSP